MNKTSITDPFLESLDLKDKSIDDLKPIVLSLLERHENEFAYSLLTHIIQNNLEESSPYNILGIVLRRLNRHSDAEDAFNQSLDQNPDDAEVLFFLSYYLMERSEFDKAESYISRAIEKRTKNRYFLMRGVIRLLAGKDGAIEDLEKCLGLFGSEELKKVIDTVAQCQRSRNGAGKE